MNKRLIIIILAAAVVATGISSIVPYSTNDYITNQRGWPIGYYRYESFAINNKLESLCLAGGSPDIGVASEQCAETIPVLSRSRIVLNFAVWLAISSVAGGTFYLLHQKQKKPRL